MTVMVYVGESEPRTMTVTRGSAEVAKKDLQMGFNRVEIELQEGENVLHWGSETRNVFKTSGEGKSVEGYKLHYLHEALDDCENCHSGKGTALKAEEPELCFECHDDPSKGPVGAKTVVHVPVADGECSSCHLPHASSEPKLLLKAVPALCAECHERVNAGADGKPFSQQHDPVESGDCLDCHLAHASDFPKLAKAGDGKLCAECHDDPTLKDGAKKKSVHEPVGAGECLSCHKVHGSDTAKLLTTPAEELCVECHEAPDTSEQGAKFTVLHPPVDEKDCLACHDAHAAENGALTKADRPALCFECHDDPRKGPDGKEFAAPHAALDDGCLPCHKPHGSDAAKLLKAPGTSLCLECHDDVRLDGNGITFGFLHTPVDRGECGGCHLPHGAPNKGLLPAKGNKLCIICHQEFHPNHRTSDVNAAAGKVAGNTFIPDNFPLEKPGLELACRGCHLHHGSEYESLLQKDRSQLCADCHQF